MQKLRMKQTRFNSGEKKIFKPFFPRNVALNDASRVKIMGSGEMLAVDGHDISLDIIQKDAACCLLCFLSFLAPMLQ